MRFIAEPTRDLIDRLPDALIEEYAPEKVGGLPLPRSREHIFDFSDNLRLVITRDKETFHVVATPAGGPVFVDNNHNNHNGIVKAVLKRISQIGVMDRIGEADTRVEFICGGHLHVTIKRGSGCFEVTSKCGSFSAEEFTTTGSGCSNE